MQKIKKILFLTLISTSILCLASCNELPSFHGHEFGEWETAIPATCTEKGTLQRLCVCGEKQTAVINTIEHTLSEAVTPPTCEAEGYTTYSCDCGYYFNSDFTNPTGHKLSKAVTAPSCEAEGYTTYSCDCGYSFNSDFTNPTGHKLSKTVTAPSCEAEGYTAYSCDCGYSFNSDFTNPTGHNLRETVTPPTCTEQGFTFFECESCNYELYGEYVAPLAHKGVARQMVYPTVNQSGHTLYECELCGYSYKGNYVKYTDVVSGSYTENTVILKKGIDTSSWNHPVSPATQERQPLDWAAIKAAGVDFVILKAGSSKSGKDEWFEADYKAAKEAGLEVGAYFYVYSETVGKTVEDALMLLEWLDGKQFEYPIYFDIEDDALRSLGKEHLTDMCFAFAEIIQSAGYYCGMYVNNDWLTNILDTEKIISSFDVWYARYPSANDVAWETELEWAYGKQMCMWQYTHNGILKGIEGKFDFNYSYKNYYEIMISNRLNGF